MGRYRRRVCILRGWRVSGKLWDWLKTAAEQKSTPPTGAVASAQASAPTVLVPQSQVVYETVQSFECVQVPVTHMQTLYRTECRTENVPVTRMISEVVNETRTVTVCVPKEETDQSDRDADRL